MRGCRLRQSWRVNCLRSSQGWKGPTPQLASIVLQQAAEFVMRVDEVMARFDESVPLPPAQGRRPPSRPSSQARRQRWQDSVNYMQARLRAIGFPPSSSRSNALPIPTLDPPPLPPLPLTRQHVLRNRNNQRWARLQQARELMDVGFSADAREAAYNLLTESLVGRRPNDDDTMQSTLDGDDMDDVLATFINQARRQREHEEAEVDPEGEAESEAHAHAQAETEAQTEAHAEEAEAEQPPVRPIGFELPEESTAGPPESELRRRGVLLLLIDPQEDDPSDDEEEEEPFSPGRPEQGGFGLESEEVNPTPRIDANAISHWFARYQPRTFIDWRSSAHTP